MTRSPEREMQHLFARNPRRVMAAVLGAVARVSIDLVVNDQALFQHALSVIEQYGRGAVAEDAVEALRPAMALAASRADRDEARAAWSAMEAVVAVCDALLEPLPIVAEKKAYDAVAWVIEALVWPEDDDPAVHAAARARVHALMSETVRETPAASLAVRR